MRDFDIMQKEVEDVIAYSQEYDFPLNAKSIISAWYKGKYKYITKLFNGETRICIAENVTTELDDLAKENLFTKFVQQCGERHLFEDTGFDEFLMENENSFFDNQVCVDRPPLKIRHGMKLLKSFKYFIPDKVSCRWAQDLASSYIQQSKITGNLYISVDPLDYLTISESSGHWRSCHSLDGDFRAGNMNYMVDMTTLVAYLAPKEDVQLRCCPEGLKWNSKTWRMLLHTDCFENVCYYSREYPFSSKALYTKVWEWIVNTTCAKFLPPKEEIAFNTVQLNEGVRDLGRNYIIGLRQRIYDMRDIIDDSDFLGYMDIMYSPTYVPRISNKAASDYSVIAYTAEKMQEWDRAFHKEHDLKVGLPCPCPRCNKEYLDQEGTLICERCAIDTDRDEDSFFRCECCGRRLYTMDEATKYDGEWLCKECMMDVMYPVRARRVLEINNQK